MAHRGLFMVGLFLLCACGSDAPGGRRDVAALAGGQEFPVDRLGEIVARGSYVPLERDVLERLAGLWVDYSLFAQRLAQGDSLLDSDTVLHAMWDDAQLQIIKHYHRDVVGQRVVVDDAVVDSAYQAGDHRLIYHVLVNAPAGMAQAEKVTRRLRAEQLRAVAASGAAGWAEANRENEDSVSRIENGSFGLIGPGETVPEFDEVAFSLGPGEISGVTESAIGYHIIRRPLLEEVREEFTTAIQDLMIQRMNVAFAGELEARWEIVVTGIALEKTREVAQDPTHARRLGQVLGTYRGGKFTTADLVRWLKALPLDYTATVRQADDEQLEQFVKGLRAHRARPRRVAAGNGVGTGTTAQRHGPGFRASRGAGPNREIGCGGRCGRPLHGGGDKGRSIAGARAAVLGRAPAHRDGVGNLNGRCRKGSGSWRPSPGITKEFRAGRKPFPSNRLRCS